MMSVAAKSLIFLALAFAFSWIVAIGGWGLGLHRTPLGAFAALTLMMAGPAFSAFVCALLFEKGRRVEALGLAFKPNLWWLAAWLIPLAICAAALVFTLLSGRHVVDPARQILALAEGHAPPEKLAQLRQLAPMLDLILPLQVLIGTLINAAAITFTEELGWRGYLHDLWRRFGFWRASLATGVIWGVWHAPAIYLYGLNYPDHRLIGIPMFVAFCTLLSPVMTFIRDRAGATWAAGLAHGTINATAGMVSLCLSDAAFPWNGSVGLGGFAALALALVLVALARPALAPAPPPA